MTLNPDWRTWAADHPVRASRLVDGLDDWLDACSDVQSAEARAQRDKLELLLAGIADHDNALTAARQFATGTRVGP